MLSRISTFQSCRQLRDRSSRMENKYYCTSAGFLLLFQNTAAARDWFEYPLRVRILGLLHCIVGGSECVAMIVAWSLGAGYPGYSLMAVVQQSWSFTFILWMGLHVFIHPRYEPTMCCGCSSLRLRTSKERACEFTFFFILCVGTNLVPMSLGLTFAHWHIQQVGTRADRTAWLITFIAGVVSSSLLLICCTWHRLCTTKDSDSTQVGMPLGRTESVPTRPTASQTTRSPKFYLAFDPITLQPHQLPLPPTIGLIVRQPQQPAYDRTATVQQPHTSLPAIAAGATTRPPRQAPLFALGAKVLVMRSDLRSEANCTVVAVPEADDSNLYTVQLDGTTGTKQCPPEQMRAAPPEPAIQPTMQPPATASEAAGASGPQEPFPLGSKVLIKRSNGKSARCTVVQVPSGEDVFYTVALDGTTGRKQCTRDEMRMATLSSASGPPPPQQQELQEPQQEQTEVDAEATEAVNYV